MLISSSFVNRRDSSIETYNYFLSCQIRPYPKYQKSHIMWLLILIFLNAPQGFGTALVLLIPDFPPVVDGNPAGLPDVLTTGRPLLLVLAITKFLVLKMNALLADSLLNVSDTVREGEIWTKLEEHIRSTAFLL